MEPLTSLSAFLYGAAGSFIVYLSMYRGHRFKVFLVNPAREWRVVLFDLLVFLACGGIVTAFVVNPISLREAFMTGATWQGIVGGSFVGTELIMMKTISEIDKGGGYAAQ